MLAKGQSDMEPEATWSLNPCDGKSKPDPPCSSSGHFHSGYLPRERHAGENQLLAQEETALPDEPLSGLLMRTHCE